MTADCSREGTAGRASSRRGGPVVRARSGRSTCDKSFGKLHIEQFPKTFLAERFRVWAEDRILRRARNEEPFIENEPQIVKIALDFQ